MDISMAQLVGGLAFFSFGLYSARDGLQMLAGDKLRALISRLTDNRIKSFGLGVVTTLVLQSSGATTAMLVSFAGTQLLTLQQAFGVILGADVGTTAVVFLMSAKRACSYAMYAIALGFLFYLGSRRRKVRYTGSVLYGFGLVFYGIYLLITMMTPLKESELAITAFQFLGSEPLWTMIIATVITAIAHSSAATIGLALGLAFAGVLSLESALPLVLGANVGSCITSFRASVGADVNAKRVAVAHLFTKIVGVAAVFPFLVPAADALRSFATHFQGITAPLEAKVGFEIAVAHLFFNVGLAAIFLPLLPAGVWIVKRLVPEPRDQKVPFGPLYLDSRAIDTPAIAFAQTKREVVRLAETAQELFRNALRLFDRAEDFQSAVEAAEDHDDKIDVLEKAIRFYLAQISEESLTEPQSRTQMALLGTAADLEEIGDTVSKEFVRLGRKRHYTQRTFSGIGWSEILGYHKQVGDLFDLVVAYMTSPSPGLADEIEVRKEAVYNAETDLRQAHLQRLHEGLKESVETSSLHLDILNNLRRIGTKLSHIVKLLKGEI